MRFLLSILTTAVLCFLAQLLLPWWSAGAVAFLVALFAGHTPGKGFLMGFLGVGLCWLSVAGFRDIANEHILSGKIAKIFHLQSHVQLLFITVFIGALIGGLFAWAGATIKKGYKTN
jgi:hypothetical protein